MVKKYLLLLLKLYFLTSLLELLFRTDKNLRGCVRRLRGVTSADRLNLDPVDRRLDPPARRWR